MNRELRSFVANTKVIFGPGAVVELPEKIKRFTPSRAVIVTTAEVVETGCIDTVKDLLSFAGVPVVLFDGVVSNPTLESVQVGLDAVGRQAGDVLVAVGGGSAIDTAKAMALGTSAADGLREFAGYNKIAGPLLPVIAVPSTAGSGSEVSDWTVLTDAGSRLIIGSPRLAPVWAVCDPELTVTVPPEMTAYTGIDGLTHAIEAYLSKRSWSLPDAIALGAAYRINRALLKAYKDGADMDARNRLMTASIMAGIALNNCGLGIAHALSNPIGAMTDAPHGLINTILLPPVMEFNLEACTGKCAALAGVLGVEVGGLSEMEAGRATVDRVRALIAEVGLADRRFGDLGLSEADIPTIVEGAMSSGNIPLNPRPVEPEDLAGICREVL
ncbi:iron-containing alcohol dehydrogenase family protein [candidate division KSB1 bacterium]